MSRPRDGRRQRQPGGGRDRPRRPARHPRRRLGALRHLAEGRRDRRARARSAHMSAFMAQTGTLVVLRRRRRRARRLDLRGARLRARHGRRPRRRLRREGASRRPSRRAGAACSTDAGIDDVDVGDFRRYGSARKLYTFKIDNVLLMASLRLRPRAPRVSHLFDRTTIAEIQRAAREGIYDIRGFGAKRRLPHFDDLLFLGARVSRYPLEGYRERCGTDVVLGARHAEAAAQPEDPDHDRRHELRRAVRARQGGARARRERGRHVDHDRRRRHDAGGARPLRPARLPAAAVALRHEPRRPAQAPTRSRS